MNTAIINVKTTPKTKEEAKQLADELGMSLSTLINTLLKQVVRTKRVSLSIEGEEPSDYLLHALKESKEDKKAGRVSPTFDSADDAIAWLDNPGRKYED